MSAPLAAIVGLGGASHPVVAPQESLCFQLGLRNVGQRIARVDKVYGELK